MPKLQIFLLLLTGFVGGFSTVTLLNNMPKSGDTFLTSSEQIARDLDGKAVPLPWGQVWPFDKANQSLYVKIVSKKRVDDFMVVVVDITGSAKIPAEAIKKDTKAAKTPTVLNLSGYAKLTYEKVAASWFLVNVENISLKAVAE